MVRASWIIVAISILAWPVTSLTVWKDSDQGILALSWIAVIYSALSFAVSAEVKKDVDEQNSD